MLGQFRLAYSFLAPLKFAIAAATYTLSSNKSFSRSHDQRYENLVVVFARNNPMPQ